LVVNINDMEPAASNPHGATGVAQCAELNWQLRGEADKRPIEGVGECPCLMLGVE
jgi:acetyl-CoA acyltransferase